MRKHRPAVLQLRVQVSGGPAWGNPSCQSSRNRMKERRTSPSDETIKYNVCLCPQEKIQSSVS